jgi:YgiT-type zinc finger domain-containing protein
MTRIFTDKKIGLSFWEGETCESCGGDIVEKHVTLHRKVKGNYVLLEDVPAGICQQCGMRYYAANVLKTVEESVRGRLQAEREILVAVYSLSQKKKIAASSS